MLFFKDETFRKLNTRFVPYLKNKDYDILIDEVIFKTMNKNMFLIIEK